MTATFGQPGRVITVGNYDGVHLGHRALAVAAHDAAALRGLVSAALFFHPHPARVLHKEAPPPPLLTLPERRGELLRRNGIDQVFIEHFDEAFAAKTPDTFVREILVDKLQARGVVVGTDFRFGRGRVGDVELLRSLGRIHAFEVEVVPPIDALGARVSSSRVRAALLSGDLATATTLLDRYYDVDGTVIRGDQRGRTIGFPTANLAVSELSLVPRDGVYAVVARPLPAARSSQPEPATQLWTGVANLGVRPTVGAGRSIEAHLFDFEGDLYDQRLRLAFVRRLRDEMKFPGLPALRQQIDRDATEARACTRELPKELIAWL